MTSVRAIVAPEAIDPASNYILLEHIVQRTGEIIEARAGDFLVKSAKLEFEEGDVLYGKLRPQLRKCCVATNSGACSSDILTLRPVHDESAYYLAALMRSEMFTHRVQRLVAGANLPRVSARELLELEVPWPEDNSELIRRNLVARQAIALRAEVRVFAEDLARLEESILD
ncbi:hypothetical protein [Clavibacter zhangzhiyongii]|uniref:hypothetical protein n=1 Tax=Clavibacter zhangzhiyongii TaxID=2768071 RepID=UPI0039E1DE66